MAEIAGVYRYGTFEQWGLDYLDTGEQVVSFSVAIIVADDGKVYTIHPSNVEFQVEKLKRL